MNIAFITLSYIKSLEDRTLYSDVIKVFVDHGHKVTAFVPNINKKTELTVIDDEFTVVAIKTTKDAFNRRHIRRGIGQIVLEQQFLNAVKKHSNKPYDVVICVTPTVFFGKSVKYLKEKHNSDTYLLLKDMWPYDLLYDNILTTTGWKGMAYRYLDSKAQRLYELSDWIGCMSKANMKFLKANSVKLDANKIEINPNSSIPTHIYHLERKEKSNILEKYDIPENKLICVYGGTLGTAQDVPFIVECMKKSALIDDFHFVIVGRGEQESCIKKYCENAEYSNATYIPWLPKKQYEQIVAVSDIGLVFLNHRGKSPNYPSRILTYMQASLPVILATDVYTDIGRDAKRLGFGLWSESNNVDGFMDNLSRMIRAENREKYGKNAYRALCEYFSAELTYATIMKHSTKGDRKIDE